MANRQQQKLDAAHKEATAFNAAHPQSTPVNYWTGTKTETPRQSTIRGRAWALLSGEAIVCVEGHASGIALTHIEVIAAQALPLD